MTRLWRNITHSECSVSGSVLMFLTNMQEPVVWLPWTPFQVFWAPLSAGTLHHGLLACGSVCLCVCRSVCLSVYPTYWCYRITKYFLFSLPRHPVSFFLYLSPSPSLYLPSSLPSSPQIDSLSVVGQTWPAHFGPAAHLSGSALCTRAERLMGPGDRARQRQRGRIREKDRGKEGVMVKGNLAVKVLHWFIVVQDYFMAHTG